VQGDELVGAFGPNSNARVSWSPSVEFGDFVLELELRFDSPGQLGHPGPQPRRRTVALHGVPVRGRHVAAQAWSGGLYDEGRRGWLDEVGESTQRRARRFVPGRLEPLPHRVRSGRGCAHG
jgi:hypothetical protein